MCRKQTVIESKESTGAAGCGGTVAPALEGRNGIRGPSGSGATAFQTALPRPRFSPSPREGTAAPGARHTHTCSKRVPKVSRCTQGCCPHARLPSDARGSERRETDRGNVLIFQHCSSGAQRYCHGLIGQTLQNRLNSTQHIHGNSTTRQYPLLHLAKYLFIINPFKSSWSQRIPFTFLGCNNAFG